MSVDLERRLIDAIKNAVQDDADADSDTSAEDILSATMTYLNTVVTTIIEMGGDPKIIRAALEKLVANCRRITH